MTLGAYSFNLSQRISAIFRWPVLLICLFTMLSAANSALGQSAKAQVSAANLRIDAYARYSISIQGATPSVRPVLKLPPEVQIVPGAEGTQRQLSVVNGVRHEAIVFTWTITVDRQGEFTIPPQEVLVQDGKTLQTNEIKLKISNDAPAEDSRYAPIFVLELEKIRFYEGEQIPVSAKLLTHQMVQLRRLNLVELPKDNFAIQRFPLQAGEELTQIGGETYVERRFTSHLSALKPGTFEVGPATMEVTMDIPLQDSLLGGRSLFTPSETRRVNAKSNTVKVHVLPLPKDGKPKNFSGLVGKFQMSAVATPNKSQVGEPLSVEITIHGEGNFDAISAPVLTNIEGWKIYPAKKFQIDRLNDVSDPIQRIGFNQVLVPNKATSQVPPFELTFFDPEKEGYVTVRTEPIEVEITPSSTPQAPGAVANNSPGSELAPAQETPAATVPKSNITDILEIHPASSATLHYPQVPVLKSKLFLALNVAGLSILALLGIVKALTLAFAAPTSEVERSKLTLRKRILSAGKKDRESFYQDVLEYLKYLPSDAVDLAALRERAYTELYKNRTGEALAPLSSDERKTAVKLLKL